mmetsp:Transcript_32116/g.89921  ORF Transcript_32116/g.89921 Transcript_32116/m.89921 type:complete len:214 (-) Transcript_32116:494-1135(-)
MLANVIAQQAHNVRGHSTLHRGHLEVAKLIAAKLLLHQLPERHAEQVPAIGRYLELQDRQVDTRIAGGEGFAPHRLAPDEDLLGRPLVRAAAQAQGAPAPVSPGVNFSALPHRQRVAVPRAHKPRALRQFHFLWLEVALLVTVAQSPVPPSTPGVDGAALTHHNAVCVPAGHVLHRHANLHEAQTLHPRRSLHKRLLSFLGAQDGLLPGALII